MLPPDSKNSLKIEDIPPAGLYSVGQPVKIQVKAETDLGYKVIVDTRFWGVIYYDDIFQGLEKNQILDAYILRVREDGKLDITIYRQGNRGSQDIADLILEELRLAGGFLPLTAQTEPDEIYRLFGVSKKKYKMALGGLYKNRKVTIQEDGIYLVKKISVDPA